MLKYRILTAIILIPIFVTLLLKLSAPAFMVLTSLIVLWGAWEWSYFIGVKKKSHSIIYPMFILAILIASFGVPIVYISYVLSAAFVWWLIAFGLVMAYPKAKKLWSKSVVVRALMGVMVLIPCWFAINFIRISFNGPYTLLFLFVLIWGADTAAYFAGRAWGKHKLAPEVSPGKTWEGLAGACVGTLLITLGVLYALKINSSIWLAAIVLSLVTVLFSIVGDLFESMLKRNVGLKDSGQLLPGHGGILDRIDSLTAAAPIFTLGAILIGKFYH